MVGQNHARLENSFIAPEHAALSSVPLDTVQMPVMHTLLLRLLQDSTVSNEDPTQPHFQKASQVLSQHNACQTGNRPRAGHGLPVPVS